MNVQNTPQTTTLTTGSFYKTLLALHNIYQPEDDIGIPKLNEETFQAAEWSRASGFADLSNKDE
jgi:hypothetical protein